jgi:hypothetical protein
MRVRRLKRSSVVKSSDKQAQVDSGAISTLNIQRKRGKKRQLEDQEEEDVIKVVEPEEQYKCARSKCTASYQEGSKWSNCSTGMQID